MVRAYFSVVFVLLSHLALIIHSAEEQNYRQSCPPSFDCGKIIDIGFPFFNDNHTECGLFEVGDCNKDIQKIHLGEGIWYLISRISQSNSLRIANQSRRIGCESFNNLTLPHSLPYVSFTIEPNITLFKCNSSITPPSDFNYTYHCSDFNIFYNHSTPPDHVTQLSLPPQCSMIQLPSKKDVNGNIFSSVLTSDFSLEVHVSGDCYSCHLDGGQCQSDLEGKFRCANAKKDNKELLLKLGILGIGGFLILIIGYAFFILWCRYKFAYVKSMFFWKKKSQANRTIEAYLENYTSLAPKRYSYSDIKKMTNNFKVKLGQGGCGGVYKGKLHDGRLVAVKILNTLKGNGEEFINEVAGIGRTSHINIVTLLGFCYEGSKRALIYEYMSNGSLEKFIYEKIPLKENRQLEWETLYQIAIGIARGLEYLHHGCSTRILHFDIKPHNILLDEEFCPKISDFGLAKLCPEKGSIISMLGARGTAGYIAPEVFCRNFGVVSHKSDVYSYGMMVLEMVGGRKNINVGVGVDRTSEIYFPHWIYDRLECWDKLGLLGVKNEDENEKARKMVLVGLWCIQTDPSNRPPISRVLDMLEGKLELLQVPPKPFLSSPPRVPADSSSTHVMTL